MGIKEYIPVVEKDNGVFVNELNTILMGGNIEDLRHFKAFRCCKKCTEIDCDILDVKYPHFIRLKEALNLDTPKAYYYAKDLPLFVEYDNRAFLIAPAVESMDDLNTAIEKALNHSA